jgi:hypothetical protein
MTTNGGRIAAHIEGTVESANERGLRLDGESDWRNFSKYGDRIAPPARGTNVRLGLDASGFVRELQVLDAAPSSASSSSRDRTITRLSVLKTAAAFLGAMGQVHEGVKSDHVIPLAERWLAWVEQERGDAELAHD